MLKPESIDKLERTIRGLEAREGQLAAARKDEQIDELEQSLCLKGRLKLQKEMQRVWKLNLQHKKMDQSTNRTGFYMSWQRP